MPSTRPTTSPTGGVRAATLAGAITVVWGLAAALWWFGSLSGCGLMDPEAPGNLVPPTVDDDPSLPAIELAGSRFHLETRGDPANPVIVLLHGGPGGDYRGLLPLAEPYGSSALSDDYFLVFWDQRGAGLSRRHDEDDIGIDVYVEDLRLLIQRFSPQQPVILLGHSWGGMYATVFLDRHPEMVRGAVLLEPGPLDADFYRSIENDLYDLDVTSEWLNDYVWSQEFFTPDDHARADYQRMLGVRHSQPKFHVQDDPPEPFWRLGAVANAAIEKDGQNQHGEWTYDFTTSLEDFPTEVLLLASEWNEVLGVEFQRRQAQEFPNATVQVIAGAGHDFQWVQPAATVEAIRQYLRRIETSDTRRSVQ